MRMHQTYGSPLKQWLKRPESPPLTRFAESLGVSRVYLSQIVASDPAKRRTPSASLCVDIERATSGAVTRADLRPDDYWLIWPDLPQPATAANDQEARDAA